MTCCLSQIWPVLVPGYRGRLPDEHDIAFSLVNVPSEDVLVDLVTAYGSDIPYWEKAGF